MIAVSELVLQFRYVRYLYGGGVVWRVYCRRPIDIQSYI